MARNLDPKGLARLLGTSYGKIRYYYYIKNISEYYDEFKVPKKNGGLRTINAPKKQLKIIQEKLCELLCDLYNPKKSVKAFVKGIGLSDNARPHIRKSFVFNVDIRDFFGSITFPRIRGLLASEPYGLQESTATVIAHLCTLNGVLPQGAPTSPVLSNMICAGLDRELISLSRKLRCDYTRFADDITFSFLGPAEYLPDDIVVIDKSCWRLSYKEAKVGEVLEDTINRHGFLINNKKVRLQPRSRKQVVTGLVVNKKVNIDRGYVRTTRTMIHSIERYGVDAALEFGRKKKEDDGFDVVSHLHGRMLFIKQIKGEDSPVYIRLAKRFNALPLQKKLPIRGARRNSEDYHFGNYMNKLVWVLEGYDGSDSPIIQGSAFMINTGKLVTCAHVFHKGGTVEKCVAYRVGEKDVYEVVVMKKDNKRDLAILDFRDEFKGKNYIDISIARDPEVEEKVSVWGFPNQKPGSAGVSRFSTKIINFCRVFDTKMAEIDKDIYDGNSGGPVLDQNRQLVGVVARGADDKQGHNAFILASELISFVED